MSFLKKFLLGVYDSWCVVMDAKINPLKYLPDRSLQAYFMIVLFIMWSAFFGLIAAYWCGIFGDDYVDSLCWGSCSTISVCCDDAQCCSTKKSVVCFKR